MRYSITDRILQLTLDLQASQHGLTLSDIEERYNVGRRTAQRMRDAVLRNFPQAIELKDDERRPRWRIPSVGSIASGQFSPDEIADLEATVDILKRDNLSHRAKAISGIIRKLKASLRSDVVVRLEPDIEALLEAEGLAMRPGPRPTIKAQIINTLRQAIKRSKEIDLVYQSARSGKPEERRLEPYGFLFGSRHYLIGRSPDRHPDHTRLFALSNIKSVRISNRSFERDKSFSLNKFSQNGFGVFQEEPVDVVWRFSPSSAGSAREYLFHPSQTMEDQDDGSLIVRFRAGGLVEMAWHVYTWGGEVDVLAPKQLRALCAQRHVHIRDSAKY